MAEIKKRKKPTPDQTAALNSAIKVLHDYCAAGECNGCPFRNEKRSVYSNPCRFGCFYPELWDCLEIKEAPAGGVYCRECVFRKEIPHLPDFQCGRQDGVMEGFVAGGVGWCTAGIKVVED